MEVHIKIIVIYSIPVIQWLKFKRPTMPSVDKGTGQLELSYVTDVNTTVILGKVWQFFFFTQRKINSTLLLSSSTPRYSPRENINISTQRLAQEYLQQLYLWVPNWKQPKLSLIDEQIVDIYTTEYWAIKWNELLVYKRTWMNLKNTRLSERGQMQKTTQCIVPFSWDAWTVKNNL